MDRKLGWVAVLLLVSAIGYAGYQASGESAPEIRIIPVQVAQEAPASAPAEHFTPAERLLNGVEAGGDQPIELQQEDAPAPNEPSAQPTDKSGGEHSKADLAKSSSR